MYCGSCGQEVTGSGQFCGSCGGNLKADSTAEIKSYPTGPASKVTDEPSEKIDPFPPEGQGKNGLAIAALSLGVASAAFFEFLPISVAAIIMSVFALVRSKQMIEAGLVGHRRAMSFWGLGLGLLYLIIWILYRTGTYTFG
jgi:hypothetical protein